VRFLFHCLPIRVSGLLVVGFGTTAFIYKKRKESFGSSSLVILVVYNCELWLWIVVEIGTHARAYFTPAKYPTMVPFNGRRKMGCGIKSRGLVL
jgi:hypothetical protein